MHKQRRWAELCATDDRYFAQYEQGIGMGQLKPETVARPPSVPGPCGPGCQLSKLLAKFGIESLDGCPCKAHARKMDEWGAEECRRNLDTIIGWLKEESGKRHLPFVRVVAKRLVLRAIRNAERE